jgi:hypothetical protein
MRNRRIQQFIRMQNRFEIWKKEWLTQINIRRLCASNRFNGLAGAQPVRTA